MVEMSLVGFIVFVCGWVILGLIGEFVLKIESFTWIMVWGGISTILLIKVLEVL